MKNEDEIEENRITILNSPSPAWLWGLEIKFLIFTQGRSEREGCMGECPLCHEKRNIFLIVKGWKWKLFPAPLWIKEWICSENWRTKAKNLKGHDIFCRGRFDPLTPPSGNFVYDPVCTFPFRGVHSMLTMKLASLEKQRGSGKWCELPESEGKQFSVKAFPYLSVGWLLYKFVP